MEFFGGFGSYVIPFLVVLTILVFVHELGHYLVARACGVKIEAFSFGFGPELFGYTDQSGCRWKFSLIPLGGYVKMFGDADPASTPGEGLAEMTPAEREVSFHFKPLRQRAAIVAAGPAANFLFAIVVLTVLFGSYGQPFTPADIATVQEGSAAEAAGMQPGDLIVEIDGATIERFEEVQQIVQMAAGERLEILVERDGELIPLSVVPTASERTDRFGNTRTVGLLGVGRAGIDYRQHDPLSAVVYAVNETWRLSVGMLDYIGQIISGTRGAEDIGGPLRIAQMSGSVAQSGIVPLIWFMAILSINLGLINLFPIPLLDGGHLMFYVIEAIRGKPLGERVQEYGFRLGLALVLSLMLFVTWNDLVQLRVVEFFRELVS